MYFRYISVNIKVHQFCILVWAAGMKVDRSNCFHAYNDVITPYCTESCWWVSRQQILAIHNGVNCVILCAQLQCVLGYNEEEFIVLLFCFVRYIIVVQLWSLLIRGLIEMNVAGGIPCYNGTLNSFTIDGLWPDIINIDLNHYTCTARIIPAMQQTLISCFHIPHIYVLSTDRVLSGRCGLNQFWASLNHPAQNRNFIQFWRVKCRF